MKRKLLSLLGTVLAVTTLASCGDKTSAAGENTNGGQVINIWCWNDEFQNRFNAFYPEVASVDGTTTTLKDGRKVRFHIHTNTGNNYQIALDAALMKQSSAKADDKIDMFLMEADYALKYVDNDFSLDVKDDIGLTDKDMAEMYDYTKTIATGTDGKLKGVSWQATPGLYAFRSDLAAKVWSDYPADSEGAQKQADFVQNKLSDWTKFNAEAANMKAKGIKAVSGYDDTYRTYSNNATTPWVKDDKVHIDDQYKNWVKATKDFADKKYCGDATLWSDQWNADQGPAGDVMGFFYSTWGINFTLAGNAGKEGEKDSLYGKYRVCYGPANYYWGGTWMVGCKGTDNLSDIKDIMLKLTCDKAIAKKITEDTQDYTNNKAAMNEIANSDFKSGFLGGQNHIKLFTESAAKIKIAAMSAYDQGCNEQFQKAMRDYFQNTATYAEAYANFKEALAKIYPEVTFDDAANGTL